MQRCPYMKATPQLKALTVFLKHVFWLRFQFCLLYLVYVWPWQLHVSPSLCLFSCRMWVLNPWWLVRRRSVVHHTPPVKEADFGAHDFLLLVLWGLSFMLLDTTRHELSYHWLHSVTAVSVLSLWILCCCCCQFRLSIFIHITLVDQLKWSSWRTNVLLS